MFRKFVVAIMGGTVLLIGIIMIVTPGPAILVIPAGLAFARAVSKQPVLKLYAPDKRHPSLAGTYLASCVVFAALTGRSPVGNSYLAAIDAPTAKFLQTVAWETVQEYYQK